MARAASGNVAMVRLLLGAQATQAKRELESMLRTGEQGVVVEENEHLGAMLTPDNHGHTPLSLLRSLRAPTAREYGGVEVAASGAQTVKKSGGWKLDVPPLLKRGLDKLAGGALHFVCPGISNACWDRRVDPVKAFAGLWLISARYLNKRNGFKELVL